MRWTLSARRSVQQPPRLHFRRTPPVRVTLPSSPTLTHSALALRRSPLSMTFSPAAVILSVPPAIFISIRPQEVCVSPVPTNSNSPLAPTTIRRAVLVEQSLAGHGGCAGTQQL